MQEPLVYEVPGVPIVLRRKAHGRVWTARVKLPVTGKDYGRVERSTGQRDLPEAIRAAHRLYADLTIRLEGGAKISRSKTFAEVAEEFLDHAGEQQRAGRLKKSRLERDRIALMRHFVPSLGNLPITEIRRSAPRKPEQDAPGHEARDLHDYLNKRITNRHRPAGDDEIVFQRNGGVYRYKREQSRPSAATLRRERQSFYAVMEFAQDRGYVEEREIPKFPEIKGVGGRRKAFTREQMEHLQRVSIARILAAKHPLRRRQRFLCHMRMMWIYLTGCRPQEIARIKHSEIDVAPDVEGNPSFKLKLSPEHLKHPTHERAVVPLPGFAYFFLEAMFSEAGYGGDDYVFAGTDRRPLGKSNKIFRRLLEEAALDNEEVQIDPQNPYYALRHTFITERLYEGMEIGKLARWCGTSVAMIERHYGHVRSEIEMTPRQTTLYSPVVIPIPEAARRGMLDFEKAHRHSIDDWEPAEDDAQEAAE